ncbi:UDP-N-acetylmuramoyl-L-alanyl-D-glutamate--2,6-diaminopimelate ligase [Nitratiruptor sp. YY09-18]|uniref:UDP-N-acetylmuramoyl-L-alanyl-D-glutamate--2, 6-diaminopimelate ligase n=1 Tax=Nitratiruptor sp. YY09-18 TaxID=2724901 RepID=UPI001914EF9B|nr:UDP-N-acetylmuramoyl-L-alanyl-D-glutamate--2,6-diaminopimelate ligase [Nitratiruptor sp. YY09-18]BCD67389.1 UDP-N-acetylmuramoyl-L-alanyl-D-glutamate--2,6-diaminopimelate ligase [Nitratiruptor sp. YY09-18]
MIYKFENFSVTDNTQEIDRADLFLKTAQNNRYIKEQPQNILIPKELIAKLDLSDIQIIGVTGTNGKTTTSAAIYSLLNDLGLKSALQGTRGFFVDDELVAPKGHTTPSILETIVHMYEAKKRGASYFVMEVSSHAIAQQRIENLAFALKVFTNISQDHLDYHKSMQSYIATKSSFFADETLKLINKDDKNIEFNVKNARTYALETTATYQIVAYSLEGGISAVLQHGSEMVDFYSPLLGLFNLYNITAAIGAVHMLTNLPLEDIVQEVKHFGGVRGRMEIASTKPLVIVDFAHTPDGMQKVFESFPGKKIVALFGAGGDRDRSKRALMGNVASRFCTKIYLTADNPRSEDVMQIIDDIKKGITTNIPIIINPNRAEAIKEALDNLEEDEILLILGKGDEEYIEIDGEKIPYSDRETVEALMRSN